MGTGTLIVNEKGIALREGQVLTLEANGITDSPRVVMIIVGQLRALIREVSEKARGQGERETSDQLIR